MTRTAFGFQIKAGKLSGSGLDGWLVWSVGYHSARMAGLENMSSVGKLMSSDP